MKTSYLTGVVIFALVACPREQPGPTAAAPSAEKHEEHEEQEEHEEHEEQEEHEEHEGHAHGLTEFGPDALDKLGSISCEHGTPVLECDNCRFEVGAVELAPALLDKKRDGLVTTTRSEKIATPRRVQLNGEVGFDERRVVHVSPRIQGVVRQSFVELGQQVHKGERLIEIDSLELGQLRSDFLQARSRLTLAKDNSKREERLFEKQVTSGSERQAAQAALDEARAALSAAEERLHLLGVSDDELAAMAKQGAARGGRLTIRSAIAGTVVTKHAVTGERLAPDKEVLTVADLSKVWVWGSVYERDLAAVVAAKRAGALRAEVRVAGFPEQAFTGEVDYIGATMDESTRTVRLRITVDNAEGLLRPGMFAKVALDLSGEGEVVQIPAEAVLSDEGQRFVFVRVGERRFMRRDVQIDQLRDGRARVSSGLRAGEEVVAKGAFLLKSDILREKMGAGCAD